MSEHSIEIRTVNAKMKRMYGDKFTWTQRGIEKRSNGLHVELRFSTRYGRISFSCTLADGVGGCRFKMIGYSHGYRWSTVRIAVTAEQEKRLYEKATEMAGLRPGWIDIYRFEGDINPELIPDNAIHFGPNHIKYDKWGASFSFISKFRLWRMHPDDMICNEAVAEDMLVVWPDLLVADEYKDRMPDVFLNKKDPATLTPDQFEYMVRHYFEINETQLND